MSLVRYVGDNWAELGPQIVEHLVIVAVSIAVAAVIGVALGVVAATWQRLSELILGITSVTITLPSFALFAVLAVYFGIGSLPVEIGLVIYALLPIVRNTNTGLRAVDPAIVEAAAGMGMSGRQRLMRVDLPLAVPLMIAGIRQATVMVVAIATVGAAVGANNLGQPIFAGTRDLNSDEVLSGVIPVALIGLLLDQLLGLVQRFLLRGQSMTTGAA